MAASDRVLPSGITSRLLDESDLDAALVLSREAGWNQTAADWGVFLELGEVIGLVRGDRIIATAATLPHGGQLAWISMVLVAGGERRQGLASWLLRRCIDDLDARRLTPVLDATPAGRAVYLGLGFKDHWPLQRLVGRTSAKPQGASSGASLRPIEPRDWPQLIAYDAAIFGADRAALLRRLALRLADSALVAERDNKLVGFLLGRDGRVMRQLGPLTAEDGAVAHDLLAYAIGRLAPPFVIDLPDRQTALHHWLLSLGFAAERSLTRMAYGTDQAIGDPSRLFAIAGPELG